MEASESYVAESVSDVEEPASNQDPGGDSLERMVHWDPPCWWIMDDNPKTSSDYDHIKAAYARAETCTVCLNNLWPPKGAEIRFSDLVLSVEEGCAGCMILSGILKVCSLSSGINKSLGYWDFARWQQKNTRWTIYFQEQAWEVFVPKDVFGNGNLGGGSPLHLSQPQPWRVPHLPRELEVYPNTGSGHAIERALAWLRDCEENHEACRGTNLKLPSRVIEIQGPDSVKLYESKGEVEPYVCLSHCWGKGSMIQTTTSSVDKFKQNIPWHELPRTFQESISFTFQLGYRYLWIDSLCIQQDSDEDWRIEGSKMAQIYSGAALTLAAAAADGPTIGCFRQTPERSSTAYPYCDPDGSRLEVHIRPQLRGEAWLTNTLPLLRRGWTLQECLLSRRMITFTDEELVWGCRAETVCECSFIDDYFDAYENVRSPQKYTQASQTGSRDGPDLWYPVIQAYNRMDLTFERDVFPALQGLSKQMYQYKKSPYIAGLWESSIISDLLWLVEFPEEVTRPPKWRAPSWSWASIIGPLTFGPRVELKALCEFVTAHIVPAGEDGFGEILSAKITLRSRCLRQDLEGSYQSTTGSYRRVKYPDDPVWKYIEQATWEDCWPESANSTKPHSTPMALGERVKTLLVAQTFFWGSLGEYQLLILRSLDPEEHIYERIGRMQLHILNSSAIDDLLMGEEETLHIV